MSRIWMFVLLIPLLLFSTTCRVTYAQGSTPTVSNQYLLSILGDIWNFFSGLINDLARLFGASPSSNSSTSIASTVSTASTMYTTIPESNSSSGTNLSTITNGAQAQDAEVSTLLHNNIFIGQWKITFNTGSHTIFGLMLATDNITFNISKTNNFLAFHIAKQTVYTNTGLGAGSRYEYNGTYNGTLVTDCAYSAGNVRYGFNGIPRLCFGNVTETNLTKATFELLSNLYGPIEEDTSREINATQLFVFPAPYNSSFTYHFIKYTSFENYPCALMSFTFGPTQGDIDGRISPAIVGANGTTCLSTAFGLPIYTNVSITGTNSSTNSVVRINGTLSLVSGEAPTISTTSTQTTSVSTTMTIGTTSSAITSTTIPTTTSTTTSTFISTIMTSTSTTTSASTSTYTSTSTTIIPTSPQIVTDSQYNNAFKLIVVDTNADNIVAQHLYLESTSHSYYPGPDVIGYHSYIQDYLVAGRTSSNLTQAGNDFISLLNGWGGGCPSSFINIYCQPIVQIVIPTNATPTEMAVAQEIASGIESLETK